MEKKYLTVDEIAEELSVEVITVREWLRQGKLKGLKAGRLWRVRPQDLDVFLGVAGDAERSRPTGDPGLVAELQAMHAAGTLVAPSPVRALADRKGEVMQRLTAMKSQGLTLQAIANRLNADGVPTISGRGEWQKGTVANLLAQAQGGS